MRVDRIAGQQYVVSAAGGVYSYGNAQRRRAGDVMLEAWTDLYWLPLGAGGHCVGWNGRVYEHRLWSRLSHLAMAERGAGGSS